LIIFIPLCILGARRYGTLLSVKYLLIQSVAGLLTLGCLIVSVFDRPSGLIRVILGLILLVKLGGFPFFSLIGPCRRKVRLATFIFNTHSSKVTPIVYFKTCIFYSYLRVKGS